MLFSGYAGNRTSLLIRVSEGILGAAIDPKAREATEEVVSEDEDFIAPFEALDNPEVSFSKGSSFKRYSFSLSLQNTNKKTKNACSALTVRSPKKQEKERLCCIFPG